MERLVSRLELARELGVEPQTIAKWERQGWFPKAASDLGSTDAVRTRVTLGATDYFLGDFFFLDTSI
jgi:transcriptional regulator with XRE-family HTH domain